MAKKQTRRSISVKGLTYQRLKAHCDAEGVSVSGYLEGIIQDSLDAVNAPVPKPPPKLVVAPEPPAPASPEPEEPPPEPVSTTLPPPEAKKSPNYDEDFNDVFGGRVEGTGRTTGDHEPWE